MSDLSATNCGCNNGYNTSWSGNNLIWIILLLSLTGNGNGILGGNGGCGCNNGGNSCCDWVIWLLLLSNFCGGNNNGGCGCGCN